VSTKQQNAASSFPASRTRNNVRPIHNKMYFFSYQTGCICVLNKTQTQPRYQTGWKTNTPQLDITTFQSRCSVDIKLSTRERQVGIRLRHQRLGDCHVDPVRFSKPRALCCLIAILQDSFNNFLSKIILFELIKKLLFCNWSDKSMNWDFNHTITII